MSAGLRGAERVRRVTREECGGPMLCVCRLLGSDATQHGVTWLSGRDGGIHVPEHLAGIAVFSVDEGFGLRVSIRGNCALSIND